MMNGLINIKIKKYGRGINVKHEFGAEAVSFFIQAPSLQELKKRLMHRSTDTEEDIGIRLAKATKELEYANDFDYIIINDDLSLALQHILLILDTIKKHY